MHRWTWFLAVMASASVAHADEISEGQVCFGKTGPTDIRTVARAANEILDNGSKVREVGRCRLVESKDVFEGPQIEVWDGTRLVVVFTSCAGEILVRGVTDGVFDTSRRSIQVGDRADVLAKNAGLACRRVDTRDADGVETRSAVRCYHHDGTYDPYLTYEVPATVSTSYSDRVRGPAARKLVMGKRITRITRGFCD